MGCGVWGLPAAPEEGLSHSHHPLACLLRTYHFAFRVSRKWLPRSVWPPWSCFRPLSVHPKRYLVFSVVLCQQNNYTRRVVLSGRNGPLRPRAPSLCPYNSYDGPPAIPRAPEEELSHSHHPLACLLRTYRRWAYSYARGTPGIGSQFYTGAFVRLIDVCITLIKALGYHST